MEYAALRAATTGNSGGTAASPAAAVLPKAPTAAAAQQQALAVAAKQHGEQAEGLPGTPLGAKRNGSDEAGECEDTAAVVVPLQSPPPTPAQIRVETRVAEWLERELLPAINRQASLGREAVRLRWAWEGCALRGCPHAGRFMAVPQRPQHRYLPALLFRPIFNDQGITCPGSAAFG